MRSVTVARSTAENKREEGQSVDRVERATEGLGKRESARIRNVRPVTRSERGRCLETSALFAETVARRSTAVLTIVF